MVVLVQKMNVKTVYTDSQLTSVLNSFINIIFKEITMNSQYSNRKLSLNEFLAVDMESSHCFGKSTANLDVSRILPKKKLPFSQQIFKDSCEEITDHQKTMICNSQKLNLEFLQGLGSNSSISKSCQLNSNNPFMKARMEYARKKAAQKQASKSKSGETVDEDLDNILQQSNTTTFKKLKKRSLND